MIVGVAAAGVSLLAAGGVLVLLEPGRLPGGSSVAQANAGEPSTGPLVTTAPTGSPTSVPVRATNVTSPTGSVPSSRVTKARTAGVTRARTTSASRADTSAQVRTSRHSGGTATTRATTRSTPRATTRPTTRTTSTPRSTTTKGGTSQASYAAQLLSLVNAERTSRGLSALRAASCPGGYATSWANHLASTGAFAHQSLTPIMRSCGATRAAENIARGNVSAAAMVAMWMGSSGHRANILDPQLTQVGTGAVRDGSGAWTAVQDFIRP